jgi:hypothetical protein
LLQARHAYTACAGNAEQMPTLHHWSEFCLSRENQLPASGLEQTPRSQSETSVSVSQR